MSSLSPRDRAILREIRKEREYRERAQTKQALANIAMSFLQANAGSRPFQVVTAIGALSLGKGISHLLNGGDVATVGEQIGGAAIDVGLAAGFAGYLINSASAASSVNIDIPDVEVPRAGELFLPSQEPTFRLPPSRPKEPSRQTTGDAHPQAPLRPTPVPDVPQSEPVPVGQPVAQELAQGQLVGISTPVPDVPQSVPEGVGSGQPNQQSQGVAVPEEISGRRARLLVPQLSGTTQDPIARFGAQSRELAGLDYRYNPVAEGEIPLGGGPRGPRGPRIPVPTRAQVVAGATTAGQAFLTALQGVRFIPL